MRADVHLSQHAVKDLAKLGRDRPRIEKALLALASDPLPVNRGYLVYRIVRRRDLDRAIAKL